MLTTLQNYDSSYPVYTTKLTPTSQLVTKPRWYVTSHERSSCKRTGSIIFTQRINSGRYATIHLKIWQTTRRMTCFSGPSCTCSLYAYRLQTMNMQIQHKYNIILSITKSKHAH